MITLKMLNIVLAVIVGTITAIVSGRVLRGFMGSRSPVIGVCVGVLCGMGLITRADGTMSFILIPYAALGISIVMVFLLKPFLEKGAGDALRSKDPDDRLKQTDNQLKKAIRHGGRLANELKRLNRKS